ncbi:hypothetical protein ACQP35_02440 [Actinobacillus pleuropneumoniae]|uniref:hypothetical protein n=1 Tax=Actinobacillus pleuropneumoniae TaxID=715 RepID=UPI00208E885E|nr:hypothetical protein [Actinobacillus pleuropneumoniae]USQ17121.1 hypothetical protein J3K87_02435 [Actinobacillus pleuropneumoniae]
MTTQLTIKSKENLDKIINVSKFTNQDYLLATLVALLTQTKCEFNTDDLRILQRNEVLVAAYNGDIPKELLFSITKESNTAALALRMLLVKAESMSPKDFMNWLFESANNAANNIENIDDFEFLSAVRELDRAQENVIKAIENRSLNKKIQAGQKASETAAVLGLPKLTGSAKQVAWAEQIRQKCLKTMPAEKIQRAAKTATTAKYWIDNYKHIL